MDLITNVKINSINSLTDARFYSGVGVQYLGFSFDKDNERYLPTEQVFQIKNWLVGPKIVGEFIDSSSVEDINTVAEKVKLDVVQVSFGFPKELISQLIIPVFQEIIIEHPSELDGLQTLLKTYPENVTCFIINLSDCTCSWESISENKEILNQFIGLAKSFELLIDTTITSKNAKTILDLINPFGLSLPAGDEESTGMQSFDEVADLMEQLEAKL